VVERPCLHAFFYTRPVPSGWRTFVVSGATEDDHRAGAPERARSILATLERRFAELDVGWEVATAVQLYAAEDAGAVVREVVLPVLGSAARLGVTWHHALPPVQPYTMEVDVRGVGEERQVTL
jgi:hypothetical protein